MEYRGVWSADEAYREGQFATDHGSMWFCRETTRDRPGTSAAWVLAVKHGKDAR